MKSYQPLKTRLLQKRGKSQDNFQPQNSFASNKTKSSDLLLISPQEYHNIYSKQISNSDTIQYRVFRTLNYYEAEIEMLQQERQTLESKIQMMNNQKQLIGLTPREPLDQNQLLYAKSTAFNDNKDKFQELTELIQMKMENEITERNRFFNILKQQFQQEESQIKEGIYILEKVFSRKTIKPYIYGFKSITQQEFLHDQQLGKKNTLNRLFNFLSQKQKDFKQYSFRSILKQLGASAISEQVDSTLKLKGKVLLGLKQYPRLTKKQAFFSWYLKSTDCGCSLLHRASDRLVLFTNINKTTAFYRLFNKVRERKRIVSPKVKRMTIMVYLYSRLFFEREKRNVFNKLKDIGRKQSIKNEIARKIIDNAELRKRKSINLWLKKVKQQRTKQEALRQISDVMKNKMRYVVGYWKNLNNIRKNYRQKIDIQKKRAIQKMALWMKEHIIAKIKQVMKDMQEKYKKQQQKDKYIKCNKFEIGLKRFVERTLGRAFSAFKNQLELGQSVKKGAVIQLINVTMGDQKRFYQRWLGITEKTRLLNECRLIGNVFSNINFAIKSVTDNIFSDNKESQIKQQALIKIFGNMKLTVDDSFRRWRQINTILKIKEKTNDQQKKFILQILNNLLNNTKNQKIRDAINKFKHNRRIIQIQRNFLKRLLMSKAGLIKIAFKKLLSLPHRPYSNIALKFAKFTKGLELYLQRTLTRAFIPFKTQFEVGQVIKKRSVIQLLNTTQSGQKRYYQKWLQSLRTDKILKKTLLLKNLFDHSLNAFSNTFYPIFRQSLKPKYSLTQILHIQSYIYRIINNKQANIKKAFQILSNNYFQTKKNPWFKKSALILALNTRVNTQKSFWRLRHNIYSTGVVYNAAIIVKLKKLFNNLRKYYELNMYKVFLTIDKYGKNLQQSEMISRQRQSRVSQRRQIPSNRPTQRFQPHHEQYQQQSVYINQQHHQVIMTTVHQAQIEKVLFNNRQTALRAIDRIFRKNMKKRVTTWKKSTSDGNELQLLSQSIELNKYLAISKIGAADVIQRIFASVVTKEKFRSFKIIQYMSIRHTTETAYDRSLDQRLELINRQNILMEEVCSYKQENEQLIIENENKQKCLRQCNETVTLLSLRINYMITQKFVALLEKVYDAVEFRNVNDAFDYIIQQANSNYERQELQDF